MSARRELEQAVLAIEPGGTAAGAIAELARDRRFVLLGEASHGTREFYAERARITELLIAQRDFDAVAVEADWPDAYRVNCYVRGAGDDATADAALDDFRRFPSWMWRNVEVAAFVERLRRHNERTAGAPVGFYGLDLYSLQASIEAVLRYLDRVDPEAAVRARERYGCFEDAGDPQQYGYATELRGQDACEDAVVEQLLELQRRTAEYARRDGRLPEDAHFFAEQNARLVRNAERYYRSIYRGRNESWNLRDRHMTETLVALAGRLERERGRPARIVVWAHNSHLGDARATELGDRGELNVGQLVRERWGTDALLVGFTTDRGTVTAASDWGGEAERKRVRPALPGSYEHLFGELPQGAFVLEPASVAAVLGDPRLERAIGVIYRPATERQSHYFHARLPDQFDVVIHIDETSAVEPLGTAGR
jgi:erythromycin esterase-like protein